MNHQAFALSLTGYLLSLTVNASVADAITPEQAFNQFEQQLESSYEFSVLSSQLNSELKTQNSELRTPLSPPPQFIIPARGILTSGYGWRWGRMHKGIDIAAPVGTPIVAAASGTVQFAGWNDGGYGYLVEILHADGSLTRYAHNSRVLVQQGNTVQQGQTIGLMGSTGYSTGPHCHFEIHLPGKGATNPIAYLSPISPTNQGRTF